MMIYLSCIAIGFVIGVVTTALWALAGDANRTYEEMDFHNWEGE